MPTPMTKHYTLYKFDELSDTAKEKAREWFRRDYPDYDWWESVYEQADTAAKHLGIDIDRKGNHTPAIYFSGFWSQGDGACFEGSYRYKKGWRKAILAEFGNSDTQRELLDIGQQLHEAQARQFYKLVATVTHRGHYDHSGCTSIDVSHDEDPYRDIGDCEDAVIQALREFMDWIYKTLEDEYDWLTSDEQVDDSIIANEYTFLENGKRED